MKNILLLSVLMFLAITTHAQDHQRDTVRVVMLVSDTSHSGVIFRRSKYGDNGFAVNGETMWMYGYSVREKHNTAEGIADPGGVKCIDNVGNEIPCYTDYWKHILYLNQQKKPIAKNCVIWQSIEANR